MPELPEVENVRRTLAANLIGRLVTAVSIRRPDVVHGRATPATLLRGRRITGVDRHGKQLAILTGSADTEAATTGDNGDGDPVQRGARGQHGSKRQRCLCVHLGMTGSLRYCRADTAGSTAAASFANILKFTSTTGRRRTNGVAGHLHVLWRLDDGGRIEFRDPRRFGGLWPFPSPADLLAQRWAGLGADALSIRPARLHGLLQATRRALKAALLDQRIVAGLGNIYVDELLFACRLHPLTPARCLALNDVQRLVRHMRRLLVRAIASGGSTFRNYVDGNGQPGWFQQRHRVYNRTGQPCQLCGHTLEHDLIAGRRSVFCPACQPVRSDSFL